MIDCGREPDVLEALAVDRMDRVREHVVQCASCAEIAEVADALRREYESACREARVPAAGTVWWRATIRARAEAARTVSQPITFAQSVAGAVAIGLAAALLGVIWRGMAWDGFEPLLARLDQRSTIEPALGAVVPYAVPVTLGLIACLVVAPVALYLALSDD